MTGFTFPLLRSVLGYLGKTSFLYFLGFEFSPENTRGDKTARILYWDRMGRMPLAKMAAVGRAPDDDLS